MKGGTEIFIGEEAVGSSTRTLLDVRGFLRAYPAASQMIDAMNHSAGEPAIFALFGTKVHMKSLNTHTYQMYALGTSLFQIA